MSVLLKQNGLTVIEFNFSSKEVLAHNLSNTATKSLSAVNMQPTIASYCSTTNCYNCTEVQCIQVHCTEVKCANVQCTEVQCYEVKCHTTYCTNCTYDSYVSDCTYDTEKDG